MSGSTNVPPERDSGRLTDPSASMAAASMSRAVMAELWASLGPGSPWTTLLDALAGEVILRHAAGRRVLDLGYGSPEVHKWVKERAHDRLTLVKKGVLDDPKVGIKLAEYPDASYEVIYCLRTFPHVGKDSASSEQLAREILKEAARLTVDGGTVMVQIANPRSLLGILEGIRQPITLVSRRRMRSGDRYALTRWDSLKRFVSFLPQGLELVDVHGLGVLTPHSRALGIPIMGRVLERLEWRARDSPLLRHFGAQLLVVCRRLHR